LAVKRRLKRRTEPENDWIKSTQTIFSATYTVLQRIGLR
jgi:hypothetical protein